MDNEKDWLGIINLFVAIIAMVVPTVFLFLNSPENVKNQTYIIFGAIMVVLIIGASMTYIISRWKQMGKDIKATKTELEDVKKEFLFKEMFNKMDVRLSVLENLLGGKNKRGQMIDPRIVFWIILLILLYLFLKSIGFLN